MLACACWFHCPTYLLDDSSFFLQNICVTWAVKNASNVMALYVTYCMDLYVTVVYKRTIDRPLENQSLPPSVKKY